MRQTVFVSVLQFSNCHHFTSSATVIHFWTFVLSDFDKGLSINEMCTKLVYLLTLKCIFFFAIFLTFIISNVIWYRILDNYTKKLYAVIRAKDLTSMIFNSPYLCACNLIISNKKVAHKKIVQKLTHDQKYL